MSSTYGVSGTSPLADLTETLDKTLLTAIKNVWNATVAGGTPQIADINFSTMWFSRGDFEIIARENFNDSPPYMRTIGGTRQGHICTVDLHVGVRSRGGDEKPAQLGQIIRGIQKILHVNRNSLISHAWVEQAFVQPGFKEVLDNKQTFWHSLVKVRIYYFMISTV